MAAMRVQLLLGVALAFGCRAQHRTNLDIGRIEERERALGMFGWTPPARPLKPEVKSSLGMIEDRKGSPSESPENKGVLATVVVPPPTPMWSNADVARRTALAADWGAHAGPGITGVQAFGPGARGLVAYGEGCSDSWVDANVTPIWPALQQHGFIAVHCQGAVARFSWPRRR
jgi:hypothetical protein